ncbi:MAG: hypothetical protein K2Q04_01445 [Hyphomicrobium sp.]|nr:hypothetical protein [Hyphomicrobium sp.]
MSVYVVATLWLTQWSLQDTPVSRMMQGVIVTMLIGSVAIWQLVGTWRASARTKAPQRWWISRWIARSVAVIVCIGGLLMLSAIPKGMSSLYLEATDQDRIGQNGYSVTIEDENLVISGYLAWGVLDAVSRELSANPGIQMFILNSPGGHVGVGTRLYNVIKSRGLDTYTTEQCASACLIPFLAGNNRYLQKGAKLGFHAVGGEAGNSIAAGTEKVLSVYRTANVPEPFIQRMLATPVESAWYPSPKELIAANVVTELVE